jgi:hypothetical protein
LKRVVEVDFRRPLAEHAYCLLCRRETVLLDSNTLILLARGSGPTWVRRLLFEWEKLGLKAVCGVCDFIRRESVNAEKWRLEGVKVQRLLSQAAESPGGMYVEFETPIGEVEADSRDAFIDVLPKALRRKLMREDGLSGTDKCLVLVAWYLQQNGLNVSVATEDEALARMCGEFDVKVR